jgi:hypothetical protein
LLAKVREVERTLRELGDLLEKFIPTDDPRNKSDLYRPR